METRTLKSWEEFEALIRDLHRVQAEVRATENPPYVSRYLFRGQASSDWKLATTLERFTGRLLKVDDYYTVLRQIKSQVETYTGAVWDRFPAWHVVKKKLEARPDLFFFHKDSFGYEHLVYLRHHGFPSPLLDWTRSPFVAAYFAFREPTPATEHASIYAFCEFPKGHKSGSIGSPEIFGLQHNVRSHRRHFQQQCEYTVCTVVRNNELWFADHEVTLQDSPESQDETWKFNIPWSEREEVLRHLERYNINAISLFGSEESLMETLAIREFRGLIEQQRK